MSDLTGSANTTDAPDAWVVEEAASANARLNGASLSVEATQHVDRSAVYIEVRGPGGIVRRSMSARTMADAQRARFRKIVDECAQAIREWGAPAIDSAGGAQVFVPQAHGKLS